MSANAKPQTRRWTKAQLLELLTELQSAGVSFYVAAGACVDVTPEQCVEILYKPEAVAEIAFGEGPGGAGAL